MLQSALAEEVSVDIRPLQLVLTSAVQAHIGAGDAFSNTLAELEKAAAASTLIRSPQLFAMGTRRAIALVHAVARARRGDDAAAAESFARSIDFLSDDEIRTLWEQSDVPHPDTIAEFGRWIRWRDLRQCLATAQFQRQLHDEVAVKHTLSVASRLLTSSYFDPPWPSRRAWRIAIEFLRNDHSRALKKFQSIVDSYQVGGANASETGLDIRFVISLLLATGNVLDALELAHFITKHEPILRDVISLLAAIQGGSHATDIPFDFSIRRAAPFLLRPGLLPLRSGRAPFVVPATNFYLNKHMPYWDLRNEDVAEARGEILKFVRAAADEIRPKVDENKSFVVESLFLAVAVGGRSEFKAMLKRLGLPEKGSETFKEAVERLLLIVSNGAKRSEWKDYFDEEPEYPMDWFAWLFIRKELQPAGWEALAPSLRRRLEVDVEAAYRERDRLENVESEPCAGCDEKYKTLVEESRQKKLDKERMLHGVLLGFLLDFKGEVESAMKVVAQSGDDSLRNKWARALFVLEIVQMKLRRNGWREASQFVRELSAREDWKDGGIWRTMALNTIALHMGEGSIPADVLFSFDSDELRPGASARLEPVAGMMGRNQNATLVVAGHTDSVGAASYNRDLSLRRAQAVGNWLVGRGVDPSRVRVVGHGEALPIAPNVRRDGSDNPQGRAMNRRVGIMVIHPGLNP